MLSSIDTILWDYYIIAYNTGIYYKEFNMVIQLCIFQYNSVLYSIQYNDILYLIPNTMYLHI